MADTAALNIPIRTTGASAATNALQRLESKFSTVGARVVSLNQGLQLLGATARGIAGPLRAVVNAGSALDAAMTKSTAIMAEMSDVMKTDMVQAARAMSRESTFSATSAAESYFFLASAGLDAKQSLAALPTVTRFAQAGMFDMALATDLLTDAQSALGKVIRNDTVANMQEMARLSDVLVKANTLANATVQQFSESLTNKAGAALRLVNKEAEEGVAVLAAFADQGIKGQVAGEQLAIALRELQRFGKENKQIFEGMNVPVFDASGNMRNMADIVEGLEENLAGLSVEQKRATLTTFGFTERSLASILALVGTSDAIRNYEKELKNAGGTTAKIAEKQLVAFNAQLTLLSNTIDNTLSRSFGIAQDELTAIITEVREWIDANDELISQDLAEFILESAKAGRAFALAMKPIIGLSIDLAENFAKVLEVLNRISPLLGTMAIGSAAVFGARGVGRVFGGAAAAGGIGAAAGAGAVPAMLGGGAMLTAPGASLGTSAIASFAGVTTLKGAFDIIKTGAGRVGPWMLRAGKGLLGPVGSLLLLVEAIETIGELADDRRRDIARQEAEQRRALQAAARGEGPFTFALPSSGDVASAAASGGHLNLTRFATAEERNARELERMSRASANRAPRIYLEAVDKMEEELAMSLVQQWGDALGMMNIQEAVTRAQGRSGAMSLPRPAPPTRLQMFQGRVDSLFPVGTPDRLNIDMQQATAGDEARIKALNLIVRAREQELERMGRIGTSSAHLARQQGSIVDARLAVNAEEQRQLRAQIDHQAQLQTVIASSAEEVRAVLDAREAEKRLTATLANLQGEAALLEKTRGDAALDRAKTLATVSNMAAQNDLALATLKTDALDRQLSKAEQQKKPAAQLLALALKLDAAEAAVLRKRIDALKVQQESLKAQGLTTDELKEQNRALSIQIDGYKAILSEGVTGNMDQVSDAQKQLFLELGTRTDQWKGQITDALVDGMATGQFKAKDLFTSLATDMATSLMRGAIVEPLLSAPLAAIENNMASMIAPLSDPKKAGLGGPVAEQASRGYTDAAAADAAAGFKAAAQQTANAHEDAAQRTGDAWEGTVQRTEGGLNQLVNGLSGAMMGLMSNIGSLFSSGGTTIGDYFKELGMNLAGTVVAQYLTGPDSPTVPDTSQPLNFTPIEGMSSSPTIYHDGGLVGAAMRQATLAADEVPAILQKGEIVVPRVLAGQLMGGMQRGNYVPRHVRRDMIRLMGRRGRPSRYHDGGIVGGDPAFMGTGATGPGVPADGSSGYMEGGQTIIQMPLHLSVSSLDPSNAAGVILGQEKTIIGMVQRSMERSGALARATGRRRG